MNKTRLSHSAAEILIFLLELAAGDGGFELRGVPGWASPSAVVQRTGIWNAQGLLATLARNALVLREDVRAPGDVRAAYVCRITQRGVDTLAEAVGTWSADLHLPGVRAETCVLLRDGVVIAWDALCLVARGARGLGEGRGRGDRNWISLRQLNRFLECEDEAADRPPRWVLSEDVRWLVQRGFAEEYVEGGTHRYRTTDIGAALRPLRWREPR
jgi:hypothetical protein